ncbi:hypothetical protein AMTRI_Chr13g86760 [Amborella trichopoda]|uniref:Uncharacterized protein n=1 Tax=Amborella trichopoda TaxID=13333 RepID=W1PCE2_AMBTC|nr:hypothetical protein AMTR_s00006p00073100 [Amborella trichopoda]
MTCRISRMYLNHRCSHPSGREPKTAVARPKKKRSLTDSIEIMTEAVNNLGVMMNKRPSNPLTTQVGEAIDKIRGLTLKARVTTAKEIVKDADVMTLSLEYE